MISADTPSLAARIDAITRFLPALEGPDAGGEWVGGGERDDGAYVMPRFAHSEVTDEFVQACYDNEWVVPFDWMGWHGIAEEYYPDSLLLSRARVATLARLFTAQIRCDRFVDGQLAGAIESGHIAAILRRLVAIRERLR